MGFDLWLRACGTPSSSYHPLLLTCSRVEGGGGVGGPFLSLAPLLHVASSSWASGLGGDIAFSRKPYLVPFHAGWGVFLPYPQPLFPASCNCLLISLSSLLGVKLEGRDFTARA